MQARPTTALLLLCCCPCLLGLLQTLLHVYEARCTVCDGTGWARAPTNGRRGKMGTCMTCHGLGCVRRTTSRFYPDDPDKHMTINRPVSWNGKLAAHLTPINIDKTLKHKGESSNGASSNSSSNGNGSSNGSSGDGA
eukprot:GHRQ01024109.1.p2 GENE.GHRQ01024109.1~~GHRQ01024109.1.p2  ORF type:complete len:137 (+),score=34.39 GHRQ01024109.1:707-1117(+)